MTNEGELTSQLVARGFAAVSAAEYTEQEKAFILSKARMVVLPVGAGMTNLIWVPRGARVVFLCAPSLTTLMGQSFCDWWDNAALTRCFSPVSRPLFAVFTPFSRAFWLPGAKTEKTR